MSVTAMTWFSVTADQDDPSLHSSVPCNGRVVIRMLSNRVDSASA